MPLKYGCFISYRHNDDPLSQRIIDDLYEALKGELKARGVEVFLDRTRLKGGDFFNQQLARALCESACMILVFLPGYFDKENTYCAREYRAMVLLEAERIARLPENNGIGFIMTVVFRSQEVLPQEIFGKREVYLEFEQFLLSDSAINKNPKYAPLVKRIADNIFNKYMLLRTLGDEVCESCDEFCFPDVRDIQDWLPTVLPENVFRFPR